MKRLICVMTMIPFLVTACDNIDVPAAGADAVDNGQASAADVLVTNDTGPPGADVTVWDEGPPPVDEEPPPVDEEPPPVDEEPPPVDEEPPPVDEEPPPVDEEPPPVDVEPPPVDEEPPPVDEEPPPTGDLGVYDTCVDDGECISGVCGLCDANSGKRFCYEPGTKDVGDVCKVDDECASGACDGSSASDPFGGACASGSGRCICLAHDDCGPTEFCLQPVNSTERVCVRRKPAGDLCAEDGWCLSGSCDATTNLCD